MKFKNIFLISTLLLLLSSQAFSSEKLIFTSIKNSSFTNFAMAVLGEAYKRIDIEISNEPLPAKRSLRWANEGLHYDGELFRISGIEKQYTNLIPIKVPLHKSQWMAYTKNKKIKIAGWQSLKPYKIGIRRGIVTTKNGTKGFDTQEVNTNKQLFEMLYRNRVDVVILSKGNAEKALDGLNYEGINMLEPPVSTRYVYHYIHKKNKHLQSKLYKVLEKMEKEGLIDKIRNQSKFIR